MKDLETMYRMHLSCGSYIEDPSIQFPPTHYSTHYCHITQHTTNDVQEFHIIFMNFICTFIFCKLLPVPATFSECFVNCVFSVPVLHLPLNSSLFFINVASSFSASCKKMIKFERLWEYRGLPDLEEEIVANAAEPDTGL